MKTKTVMKLGYMLQCLETIRNLGSRKSKEMILSQMIDYDKKLTEDIFSFALNPFWNYGVRLEDSRYPLPANPRYNGLGTDWDDWSKLLLKLRAGDLTGNRAREAVEELISESNGVAAHWFKHILNQNLRIGLSGKTIKKMLPGLLPETTPMLCKVLDPTDEDDVAYVEHGGWIAEPKYDGLRCLAFVENGEVGFVSRNGKDMWNLELIKANLADLEPKVRKAINSFEGCVFDGELYAGSWNKTISIVHTQSRHPDRDQLRFYIFDVLPTSDWKTQKSSSLAQRKHELKTILPQDKGQLSEVPYWYIKPNSDTSIPKLLKKVTAAGFEGLVAKNRYGKYSWGRSKDWLKCKPVYEDDFRVVAKTAGTGKNKHTLGALWISGGTTFNKKQYPILSKVGSGFSDEARKKLWGMSNEQLLKTVVQVEFQEVSLRKKDARNGFEGYALRFPVFVRIREDK